MDKHEFLMKWKPRVFKLELSDGTVLHVKELSAKDKEQLDLQLIKNIETGEMDLENFRSKVLIRMICDENGNRMFGDEELEAFFSTSDNIVSEMFGKVQEIVSINKDFSKK